MSKMKKIKKARFALPSLVTLGSVFCSFWSMTFVFQSMGYSGDARLESLFYAALAIIGSIVFDTFDGKVARLTHTSTKFGMELDSLADGVSFGVAPAFLMYGFALHQAGVFGLIACFLFISGSLLRLARFNIEAPDEGVQTYFKGIPAPGGAACLAALVLAAIDTGFTSFTPFEIKTLGAITIAVGLLMVSNVKYKTLKGKKTKGDYAYVLIGISFFAAMCFLYTPSVAFFLLVLYFVAFGMLNTIYLNLNRRPRKRRKRRHQVSEEVNAVKSEEAKAVKSDEPAVVDTEKSDKAQNDADKNGDDAKSEHDAKS